MQLARQSYSLHLCHGCFLVNSAISATVQKMLLARSLHTAPATSSTTAKHHQKSRQRRIQAFQLHRLPGERTVPSLENLRWGHAMPFDASAMAPKEDKAVDSDRPLAGDATRGRAAPFQQEAGDITDNARAYVQLANSGSISQQPSSHMVDDRRRTGSIGKSMPSSVMYRLNIKFYADVKRRRQQQGMRIRMQAVLSELRHLIQVCWMEGDSSERIYKYIEDLNRLYIEYLSKHAQRLKLRSGTYATVATGPDPSRQTTAAVMDGLRTRLTRALTDYNADNPRSPLLERARFRLHVSKGQPQQQREPSAHKSSAETLISTDPCAASWIDYLVDDLSEAEAHQLFCLVARSKAPKGVSSRYTVAIEEALVFAFNRAGYALDPLESMRMCAYFLRQPTCAARVEQLMFLWRHAGEQCYKELHDLSRCPSASSAGSIQSIAEMRFKRWNNAASMLIASLCQEKAGLQAAWALLGEWHVQWTKVMKLLCPVRRHGFATGTDKHTYPFWRSKQPGRCRLHQLTLSTAAVNKLLLRLVLADEADRAAELLGFATSEIGVVASSAMFNTVLRGFLDPVPAGGQDRRHLRSLSALALTNKHSVALYSPHGLENNRQTSCSPNRLPAETHLLFRGMARWGISPDKFTLEVLVSHFCLEGNARMLSQVVDLFATKWNIRPTEHCWKTIEARTGGQSPWV